VSLPILGEIGEVRCHKLQRPKTKFNASADVLLPLRLLKRPLEEKTKKGKDLCVSHEAAISAQSYFFNPKHIGSMDGDNQCGNHSMWVWSLNHSTMVSIVTQL
jgi:hypothetical protein